MRRSRSAQVATGALPTEELWLGELLVRAAFDVEDPLHAIELRRIAADCRQRAKVLRRHLGPDGQAAPGASGRDFPPRGHPRECLRRAMALVHDLRILCREVRREARDPYFSRFLEILADGHRTDAMEIERIAGSTVRTPICRFPTSRAGGVE